LSVTCDKWVVLSGTPVSSTNKTDRHDITEILLKVALNTTTITLFIKIYLAVAFNTNNNNTLLFVDEFYLLLQSLQELWFRCWENLVITPADC